MIFTDPRLHGTIPPPPVQAACLDGRSVFPQAASRRAHHLVQAPPVRMTKNQQGVLSVRLSLVCATLVAVPLSSLSLMATTLAQGPPPGGGRPVAAAPAPAAQPAGGTNVVVIDVANIFKNHIRFNEKMKEIKNEIDQFEASIRAEQTKFNQKRESLAQFNPSSPEYKKLEEELARMQSEVQVQVGLKRKAFLEQEAREYFKTYKEIEQSVAVFAQQNRIGLVLRFNGDEMKPDSRESVLQGVNKAVVYHDRLDITEWILRDLNRGATATPSLPAGQTSAPGQPGGPVPQMSRPQIPGKAPLR
jgi:Skp family chaperone for outer membrane proteins